MERLSRTEATLLAALTITVSLGALVVASRNDTPGDADAHALQIAAQAGALLDRIELDDDTLSAAGTQAIRRAIVSLDIIPR